jgi:transcription elongation factor Elf1
MDFEIFKVGAIFCPICGVESNALVFATFHGVKVICGACDSRMEVPSPELANKAFNHWKDGKEPEAQK